MLLTLFQVLVDKGIALVFDLLSGLVRLILLVLGLLLLLLLLAVVSVLAACSSLGRVLLAVSIGVILIVRILLPLVVSWLLLLLLLVLRILVIVRLLVRLVMTVVALSACHDVGSDSNVHWWVRLEHLVDLSDQLVQRGLPARGIKMRPIGEHCHRDGVHLAQIGLDVGDCLRDGHI